MANEPTRRDVKGRLGELKEVNSVDPAAIWPRRSLPAKNSLNLADAERVENAFQATLAELALGADKSEPGLSSFGSIRRLTASLERKGPESTRTATVQRIEKSAPARLEPRRPASGRSSPPAICTKPSTWKKGQ